MISASVFLISDLRTSVDIEETELFAMAQKRLSSVGIHSCDLTYGIYRRSVDARRPDRIRLIWTVSIKGEFSQQDREKLRNLPARELVENFAPPTFGSELLKGPILIVGSGPAGLFCALTLAKYGYRPHMIERGGSVRDRETAVSAFLKTRVLDPECNIQFGAGGAGTFSDGKLMTRINDPTISTVLKTFVDHGAPPSILYQARPHIGTDILRDVVSSMTKEICSLGGMVSYRTRLDSIHHLCGSLVAECSDTSRVAGALVLATGHSARDTYSMLMSAGLAVEPKSFSVGVRIEHLQSDIDRIMYGKMVGHPRLGHAEYSLSYHYGDRGVYSFCMCPGGQVMASQSETDSVVVNGMSNFARDGDNANSALAVSVFPTDYGSTPQRAIAFQRKIERAAFEKAGSDYSAPILTVGDLLEGKCCTEPSYVLPSYMDGDHYSIRPLREYLPAFVEDSLIAGLKVFGHRMPGFDQKSAVLTGPETRTSAPVRILRSEDGFAPGWDLVYPCGEGAGYAGGITSAAVDGIRTAYRIMNRFAPLP